MVLRIPIAPVSETATAPRPSPTSPCPTDEFGLDVLALVGWLRHAEHRSIPEIHQDLTGRGLVVAPAHGHQPLGPLRRAQAPATADPSGSVPLRQQRRVILVIDGLQPDVGHEVLLGFARLPFWRDPPGQEPLVVHRQGSGCPTARRCTRLCPCPSQATSTAKKAFATPSSCAKGVPHQLCQFHDLREAAKPISEADRHAKKELNKGVRGIRRIQRQAEKAAESDPDDEESDIVRDDLRGGGPLP